jgi:hypothetical protein
MNPEPNWREQGKALEWWALAAFAGSSFIYGAFGGLIALVG